MSFIIYLGLQRNDTSLFHILFLFLHETRADVEQQKQKTFYLCLCKKDERLKQEV